MPGKGEYLSKVTQRASQRGAGQAVRAPWCPFLPLGQLVLTWYLDSPYVLVLTQPFPLDLSPLVLTVPMGPSSLLPLPSQIPFSVSQEITSSLSSALRTLCSLSLAFVFAFCPAVCRVPGGPVLAPDDTHGED